MVEVAVAAAPVVLLRDRNVVVIRLQDKDTLVDVVHPVVLLRVDEVEGVEVPGEQVRTHSSLVILDTVVSD